MNSELIEVEKLVEALEHCSNEKRYATIFEIVIEVLEPHVKNRDPKALWLKSRLPNLGECSELESEIELDKKWLELIKESSDNNCKESQYQYACFLYENNKVDEAIHLYKISADAGYAPSQWCFGLDCINGTGMTKNIGEGVFYIRMSAEQRYEEAVNFMLNAITNKLYDLERNEREIDKWKMISEQLL